ncbi:hypothetical protein [Nostoc sp.]|uniref:hypothetical protein n=1 Tax=Nostoc sp. TaxID=1180 RepID=UPI002FFC3B31
MTLVPLYETLRERYRYAISRGFRPATELLHHQIYDMVGVQKLRLFRRSRRDAKSVACFSVRVRRLAFRVAIRQSYRIPN